MILSRYTDTLARRTVVVRHQAAARVLISTISEEADGIAGTIVGEISVTARPAIRTSARSPRGGQTPGGA